MATPATTADDAGPEPIVLPSGFTDDSEASERVVPLRPGDLTRLLLAQPELAPTERRQFGQFAKMVGAVFHHEFHTWLDELKELYAPFDPDSDCVDLEGHSAAVTDRADEAFLKPFEAALVRANYRPLSMKVIELAVAAPNEEGLNYIPDFALFEHLKVYVRGSTRVSRFVRNFRTRFRRREVVHDGYQRFIVAMKFRPGIELGDYVRSDVVYLRMFKDVPHVDMEMHLPEQGTKVRMRWIDKAQIASPIATGLPTLALKLLSIASLSPFVLGSLLVVPITAGVNSFFGFQRAKHRHLSKMIRHLYYLTLANNASVINRLVDSAEEEEYKEALLAYYCLWRRDDDSAWDERRLDVEVETFLKQKAGLDIDFEIRDALRKLFRLGIIHRDGQGHLSASPIDRALAILDSQWDNYFRFPEPAPDFAVEDAV